MYYAQTDPRWAKLLLGYNTDRNYTLGGWGCLVTSWGNMLIKATGDPGYTPEMINTWMRVHNGFIKGGGIFIWGVALGMGHVQFVKDTTSVTELNSWLRNNPLNSAIVRYRLSHGKEHYCLAHREGFMIDAEDGREKPLGTYSFQGAKMYQVVGGKGAGVPVSQEAGVVETKEQLEQRLLHGPGGVDEWIVKHHEVTVQLKVALEANKALEAQVEKLMTQVPDFRSTYRKDQAVFRVVGDHSEPDYAGKKPNYELTDGMIFRREGIFVAPDGKLKYRTNYSVQNGDWYGADPEWLELVPGSDNDQDSALHLYGAQLVGVLKRIEVNLSSLFKKSKES